MVDQLQAAEDAGQRVWIIGHIPIGAADLLVDQVCFSVGCLHGFLLISSLRTVKLLRSSAPEIQKYHCGPVLWTYAQGEYRVGEIHSILVQALMNGLGRIPDRLF
jgi:hypothetical protein